MSPIEERRVKIVKAQAVLSHYAVGSDERDLLKEIARVQGYVEIETGRFGRLLEIRPVTSKTRGHQNGR